MIVKHRWRRGLFAICCVALVLRVVLIVTTPHFAFIYDSADYQAHGAAISLGFGYPRTQFATPGTPSAFRPPAYPYLLGGAYAVFGIHPDLGRLIGALLGTATVLLTALLGAALWDRRVGLYAGSITALFPSLIVMNGALLSESLFLPLEGLALTLLTLRRRGPAVWLALIGGVLCGLAALTRTNGIVFMIPTLCAIGVAPGGWRQRAKGASAVVVACILVLTPWTIRNAETFHAFIPLNTQEGITLAGVYNNEAGRDNAGRHLEGVPDPNTGPRTRHCATVHASRRRQRSPAEQQAHP
jgi:4-amino-4-deoxy-L-arabinose transferase-like glycosyltransferase